MRRLLSSTMNRVGRKASQVSAQTAARAAAASSICGRIPGGPAFASRMKAPASAPTVIVSLRTSPVIRSSRNVFMPVKVNTRWQAASDRRYESGEREGSDGTDQGCS